MPNRLRVSARYFWYRTVALNGHPADLRAFAAALHVTTATDFELDVPAADSGVFEGYLRILHVEPTDQLVMISHHNDVFVVAGDAASRRSLAENIDTFAGDRPLLGSHIHLDTYPGHLWLMEGSEPLEVSRLDLKGV